MNATIALFRNFLNLVRYGADTTEIREELYRKIDADFRAIDTAEEQSWEDPVINVWRLVCHRIDDALNVQDERAIKIDVYLSRIDEMQNSVQMPKAFDNIQFCDKFTSMCMSLVQITAAYNQLLRETADLKNQVAAIKSGKPPVALASPPMVGIEASAFSGLNSLVDSTVATVAAPVVAPKITVVASKDATAPVVAPVVASKDATAPVVASKDATAPVVASKDATAPVVASKDATAPVVASKDATAPVVASKDATAPVVASKDATAPVAAAPVAVVDVPIAAPVVAAAIAVVVDTPVAAPVTVKANKPSAASNGASVVTPAVVVPVKPTSPALADIVRGKSPPSASAVAPTPTPVVANGSVERHGSTATKKKQLIKHIAAANAKAAITTREVITLTELARLASKIKSAANVDAALANNTSARAIYASL